MVTAGSEAMQEIASEFRYVIFTRYLLWALLLGVVVGLASAMSLDTATDNAVGVFHETLVDAQNNNIDVKATLKAPLNVETSDGGVSIDNPLRYDFEGAWRAVGMLNPMGYTVNALQLVGFIFIPLVAVAVGAVLATKDYRYRTIRVRAVRSSLGSIYGAYLMGALIVSVTTALGAVLAAVVTGYITKPTTLSELDQTFFGGVEPTISIADSLSWVGFVLVSASLYSLLGCAIGSVLRRTVVPIIAFTAIHLAVPIMGSWDPRSLVLAVGTSAAPFEGTLFLRAVSGAPPLGVSLGILAGIACVLWVGGWLAMRVRPRWGGV